MTGDTPRPQVTVLDAGGQYCHLIARRVRELGVYADVLPSNTPARELHDRKALILSGGPSSVYEPGSPSADPGLFSLDAGVLGICYGHQLMAYLLDGQVRRGDHGEYGMAVFQPTVFEGLLAGMEPQEPVWMSHRDVVVRPPAGFALLGTTSTCEVAAMGDSRRRLYGVQFHPEVAHTRHGMRVLSNFVFDICGCRKDWDPRARIQELEERIRQVAGDRNIFFFASGGVDSSVAYTLCLRALGEQRVRGTYVDTGLMREGETDFVRRTLGALNPSTFQVEDASAEFLSALEGVVEPERKRHIIGGKFVDVQERILQSGHYLDGHWILGQGTIYPDTIESGGTASADVIKTHHNRVPGIQRLIAENRIIEPLTSFYKDEVREIGRELGLPAELLDRHPFPGPALAIRLLCSEHDAALRSTPDGWLIPVNSVGVQGDSRSYRPVLALDAFPAPDTGLHERATELVNRMSGFNRVVALAGSRAPLAALRVFPSAIDPGRLARLRRADAIVRRLCAESGFEREVWQFPVVVIPVGEPDRPDSVVLRPVDSVDGMTARSVLIPETLLRQMTAELLDVPGVCAVFLDLTHKPPGTIEWE